uniref:Inorganic phosphate cotransporter n=1 Tax=Timema genevievae TaxID=629358 RepID=A0A7R9K2W8_TIMGE|nr:unnamed protein product [Timema genevievae]
MAEMFSAKWVLFVSALLNIVGCLLTPSFSYLHYSGLLVLRVLQGIGGVSGPLHSVTIILVLRGTNDIDSSALTSVSMGTKTPVSSGLLLTEWSGFKSHLGLHRYYFSSTTSQTPLHGLSFPAMHVMIAKLGPAPGAERHILSHICRYGPGDSHFHAHDWGHQRSSGLGGGVLHHGGPKALKVPWVKILTSLPFWGILVAHICSNSGWYMMLIELPTYMNQILKFSIAKNALLSSMPFLIMWFFSIALSKSLDTARNKKYITTTTARKIATGIATLVPCVCLVAVSFIGCDRTGAVALMTVGTMAIGGMFSGFLSNHIDIAPNFAGENQRLVASRTLIGITNTLATIPGFVVPLFVGYMTHNNQTIAQWRIIFLTMAALYVLGFAVYTLFGSGEEQSWNETSEAPAEETEAETQNTPM